MNEPPIVYHSYLAVRVDKVQKIAGLTVSNGCITVSTLNLTSRPYSGALFNQSPRCSRAVGRQTMTYELLYIIPSRYTDAEVEEIQTKVKNLLSKVGGKIIKEENLGRIRLAYPIRQTQHGIYVLIYFESEAVVISELERQLRLTAEVLRFLIIQQPEGIPERSFLLESYVAPLSEEDEESRRSRRPTPTEYVRPLAPTARPEIEPTLREEKPLSIEELDKKLDEILDVETLKNI